jgi:pantothenate kinase
MAVAVDIETLAKLLFARKEAKLLVAIAGAPGSGKSTVAAKLEALLNADAPRTAAILPMDGFHYDDILLNALDRRARKGAPDTFDVGGLRHILQRLRNNDETTVAVPVFDRDIEIARAGARLIENSVRIVLVEGNYLLLREPPWNTLRPVFDVTVLVSVDENELRKRLTARWRGYGLPAAEIRRRVEENDLPNGRVVASVSIEPDYRLA